MGSGRLSTLSVTKDNMADLPGYCALTFTLMPVGSTSQRSVQVLGFASIGPLTPPCRLYPLPVRQASALPTASSRFHLAIDTLAVQLTLPLAGCVGDLHPQVSAPCRAHQTKSPRSRARAFALHEPAACSTFSLTRCFRPISISVRAAPSPTSADRSGRTNPVGPHRLCTGQSGCGRVRT